MDLLFALFLVFVAAILILQLIPALVVGYGLLAGIVVWWVVRKNG